MQVLVQLMQSLLVEIHVYFQNSNILRHKHLLYMKSQQFLCKIRVCLLVVNYVKHITKTMYVYNVYIKCPLRTDIRCYRYCSHMYFEIYLNVQGSCLACIRGSRQLLTIRCLSRISMCRIFQPCNVVPHFPVGSCRFRIFSVPTKR